MSDTPDYGYVIRWRHSTGGWMYDNPSQGSMIALNAAKVMTLREISKRIQSFSASFDAEIVRVRRVSGEDQWVPLTDAEAVNLGYVGFNGVIQEIGPGVRKRIPGESRWEICEENDA